MSEHERHVRWRDPREALAAAVADRLSGLDFMAGMMRGEVPYPPLGVLLGFEIDTVIGTRRSRPPFGTVTWPSPVRPLDAQLALREVDVSPMQRHDLPTTQPAITASSTTRCVVAPLD